MNFPYILRVIFLC